MCFQESLFLVWHWLIWFIPSIPSYFFLSCPENHSLQQTTSVLMTQMPWNGIPPSDTEGVHLNPKKNSNSSDSVQWLLLSFFLCQISTSPSGWWAHSRTAGSVRQRWMAAGGGPSLSSPAPSAGCSCPEPSGRARTPSVTRRHTENTVNLEKRAGRLLKSQFHSEVEATGTYLQSIYNKTHTYATLKKSMVLTHPLLFIYSLYVWYSKCYVATLFSKCKMIVPKVASPSNGNENLWGALCYFTPRSLPWHSPGFPTPLQHIRPQVRYRSTEEA